MARRVAFVLAYGIVCIALGAVGAVGFVRLPTSWNGALLGIFAGLVTVLSAASFGVFSKLDGILKDADVHDALRVRRIYEYVSGLRARTLILLVITVVAGLTVGAIALLLPKLAEPSVRELRTLYFVGYGGVGLILLFMLRVAQVYISLDRFRRELFAAIAAENRRIVALNELRPSVLAPFEDAPIASTR